MFDLLSILKQTSRSRALRTARRRFSENEFLWFLSNGCNLECPLHPKLDINRLIINLILLFFRHFLEIKKCAKNSSLAYSSPPPLQKKEYKLGFFFKYWKILKFEIMKVFWLYYEKDEADLFNTIHWKSCFVLYIYRSAQIISLHK